MIAKQKCFVENSQNYDSIEWTTADPVTGTVGKFSYTAEGTARFTEENEPLGQKVAKENPTEMPPPTYSTFIGSAGDMEWQCQIPQSFYGGFSGMPFHCQKKMLMDLDYGLADLYGFSQKEENPHKVPDNDPIAPSQTHGGSEGMPADITPTNKPQAETSDVKFVPAANIPGSGSDDDVIRIETHVPKLPADLEKRFSAEFGGDDDK